MFFSAYSCFCTCIACIAYDVSSVVFFSFVFNLMLPSFQLLTLHYDILWAYAHSRTFERCQQQSHLHWSNIIAHRYRMHTWWISFYCGSWHTQRMHKPILVSSPSGKPCTTYHLHQVFKFCGKLMLMAQLPLSTFHIWSTESECFNFFLCRRCRRRTCAFAGKSTNKIQFWNESKENRAQGVIARMMLV